VGDLQDSSMVARRIGTFQTVTCAAPTYLERHGVPHTIEDLQQHQSVHYFSSRTGRTIDWDFVVDGVTREVKMDGKLSVNDGDAYVIMRAARLWHGAGAALHGHASHR
jgi:LysR family transcriptional regulator for bpeEF and oprC